MVRGVGPLNKFGAQEGQGLHDPYWPKSRLEWYRDCRGALFLRFSWPGAEVCARTPTPFSEALDGWRRAWVCWTPPEEARDRLEKHLGFARCV